MVLSYCAQGSFSIVSRFGTAAFKSVIDGFLIAVLFYNVMEGTTGMGRMEETRASSHSHLWIIAAAHAHL